LLTTCSFFILTYTCQLLTTCIFFLTSVVVTCDGNPKCLLFFVGFLPWYLTKTNLKIHYIA
jgi:hypothetical protein